MRLAILFACCLSVEGFLPLSRSRFGAAAQMKDVSLSMSIPDPIDTLTSGLASICRLPGGVTVIDTGSARTIPEADRPQLKQLYDIENSKSCRQVRERITELDLVVELVIPAASNSRVFADKSYQYKLPEDSTIPRLVLVEASGKDVSLVGADAILSYLDEIFSVPMPSDNDAKEQAIAILRKIGGFLAVLLRNGRGVKVSPAAGSNAPRPKKPLVLYSYEGNQFCRLVREVLMELDIPYELRSCGKSSSRREELAEITGGSTQCPYLIDPNTDVSMAESANIARYLYKTYALWTPPNELLQWASDYILPAAKPLFAKLAPLQAGASREDEAAYRKEIDQAKADIQEAIQANPVVVYTYGLSPFSSETKALLDSLEIQYKEISLGAEWIPGLIAEGGARTRAALLEMTGQSSLPQIFIGARSIGGLFGGTPGLLPALEDGSLKDMVSEAVAARPGSGPPPSRPELATPSSS